MGGAALHATRVFSPPLDALAQPSAGSPELTIATVQWGACRTACVAPGTPGSASASSRSADALLDEGFTLLTSIFIFSEPMNSVALGVQLPSAGSPLRFHRCVSHCKNPPCSVPTMAPEGDAGQDLGRRMSWQPARTVAVADEWEPSATARWQTAGHGCS